MCLLIVVLTYKLSLYWITVIEEAMGWVISSPSPLPLILPRQQNALVAHTIEKGT